MVLFIKTDSGQVKVECCPKDVNELLQSCSSLKFRSQEFVSKNIETVSPDKGLVYVGQGEMAVGVSDDKNVSFFGSEDATTCHIIILRHEATGATGVAHLDQVIPTQLEDLVETMFLISGKNLPPQGFDLKDAVIDVSLIGGYDDERHISKKLSINLIKWILKSEYNFCLNILVIGELNTDYTKPYPCPIFLGAGIDLKSGSIFPAKFTDHGPENILRHVRLSHRNDADTLESARLFNIYNHETGEISIPLFKVRQLPQEYQFLTRVPDQIILQNFSTSPKVEPPHFASEIRESIRLVLSHPQIEKSYFKDASERIFRRCDETGKWILKSN